MGLIVTETKYGKRIQADEEIEIVSKAEWERMKSALTELERHLKGTMDLVRNAHKYGMIGDDKSLDYVKFVIYDSVNKGMNLSETKARVVESEPNKDTGAVTREYNKYTVKRGVLAGWDVQRIYGHLRGKGSEIGAELVSKYVSECKRG